MKIWEKINKFAIIWIFIKTWESCKFANNIFEYSYIYNNIGDNDTKTIWV